MLSDFIKKFFETEGIGCCWGMGWDEFYREYVEGIVAGWELDCPERQVLVLELLEKELGEDAKVIVGLVLDLPDDFAEYLVEVKKGGLTQTDISDYLRFHGWTVKRVRKALAEVKKVIKNLD